MTSLLKKTFAFSLIFFSQTFESINSIIIFTLNERITMPSSICSCITSMLEAQSNVNTVHAVAIPNLWDEILRDLVSDTAIEDVNVPNVHGMVSENYRSKELLYPLHGALCLKHCKPPLDVVKKLVDIFPDALLKRTVAGMTPLHLAVNNMIDLDVINFILAKCPAAARAPTPGRKQLPLHFTRSAEVTHLLLDVFPAGVSCSDINGNLPLHLAASRNEVPAEVIEILLDGYRKLQEKDETACGVLALNKKQMSPLQMTRNVFRSSVILIESENLIKLAWDKFSLCLLALAHYRGYKSGTCLHVALSMLKEEFLQQYALTQRQSDANISDALDRYPLCIAAMNENVSKNVIRNLIQIFPEAAHSLDKEKRLPLHYAILCRRGYENGIDDIIAAAPSALTCIDGKSGLLPFMLSVNGCDLSTTYRLLRQEPSVLKQYHLIGSGYDKDSTRNFFEKLLTELLPSTIINYLN